MNTPRVYPPALQFLTTSVVNLPLSEQPQHLQALTKGRDAPSKSQSAPSTPSTKGAETALSTRLANNTPTNMSTHSGKGEPEMMHLRLPEREVDLLHRILVDFVREVESHLKSEIKLATKTRDKLALELDLVEKVERKLPQ